MQDEGRFEEKVFTTDMDSQKTDNITSEQTRDQVIARAKRDLEREGYVSSGKLKKVSSHLYLDDGVLYFDKRLMLPKKVRK